VSVPNYPPSLKEKLLQITTEIVSIHHYFFMNSVKQPNG